MNCFKCGTDTRGMDAKGNPLCAICMIGGRRALRRVEYPVVVAAVAGKLPGRKSWSMAEKRAAVLECIQIRALRGNVDLPIQRSQMYKFARDLGMVVPELGRGAGGQISTFNDQLQAARPEQPPTQSV